MYNWIPTKLLFFCSSLLWLCCCQTAPAEADGPYPTLPDVDSLLAATSVRPFSGVVLVKSGNEILHFTGSGLNAKQEQIAFTPETSFVIGSISKQVTATLILREYQRGNINLDWHIGAYLPRLSPGWKDTVTVRQLLNHTHGIINRDQPLAFPPSSSFAYSNLGYQLLSEILEATTDQSYPELANDLFESLGMLHSTAIEQEVAKPASGLSRSTAGVLSIDSTTFTGSYLPAAYLISSANDLVLWNEALHQGGILDSLAYQQMITPSVQQDHSLFGEIGYGYGIRISDQGSLAELGHTGYVNGYVSLNLYYPDSKTSLIVLENLDWQAENIGETFFFEMGIREVLRRRLDRDVSLPD